MVPTRSAPRLLAALLAAALTAAPLPAAAQAGSACGEGARPANLDFTLKDMDGRDVRLSAYRGKLILLNFWATWCGPCRGEVPHLVALQQAYGARGLQVIGIAVDDSPDAVRRFAAEFGMTYPLLQGRTRDAVQQAFGPIWGLPATFLIGPNGRICRKRLGAATGEWLETQVAALLGPGA